MRRRILPRVAASYSLLSIPAAAAASAAAAAVTVNYRYTVTSKLAYDIADICDEWQ